MKPPRKRRIPDRIVIRVKRNATININIRIEPARRERNSQTRERS